ncbi:hypothetical protein [Pontibacillus sp. HMF3514]|uniref:hypothetical protein n=1 Tax=Pontibacillus sp. HMF3514 TaxID=2692425 RepID=UPI00131F862B|nr:hypothetical protein [Pontibacillus sp. HMF3514]QHE52525.1 hypothetical protein GS400_11000 [Pontibacillus sp. HMF3514]
MHRKLLSMMILTTFLLSGCLYPENRLAKNQTPNQLQLDTVQKAVDQFVEQHPMELPIKTREQDVPIFRKYPVNFERLKETGIMSELPGNSYERGGVYQYVIITPEEDPTVKVIDLRTIQDVRDVNMRLIAYRNEHKYPPFKEEVAEDIYSINYELIGLDEPPTVVSPYSGNRLPILMDVDGNLYIDYRQDLYNALQEYDHNYVNGDDIRFLLADHSAIVPAYSLPYTVKDGEPVFYQKGS